MGCACSKQRSSKRKPPRQGQLDKPPSRINSSSTDFLGHSKRQLGGLDFGDAKDGSIEPRKHSSIRFSDDQIVKKPDSPEIDVPKDPQRLPSVVVGTVPKEEEMKQEEAGWPTWLVAVAREALVGWVPRRASSFQKLEKIGEGTYSSVYRARDLDREKIVALKKVRFDLNDMESVKFMAREIIVLRRLDHPNVIKLEGLITAPRSSTSSLYLVFEYMEHDLVGLASLPGVKFSEPQVKCYVQQLLSGLDHCHSRGVLHRDIKGSNLLIDSNGILKIADFGLATFFDPLNSVPLTTRVVTLWYRPPELLLGASHYGVGVDLWSTGCILGELYAGKPILPGKTEVEQLHKIFKLCGSPSEDYWRKLKLPPSTVFKPALPYGRRVAEMFKEFPAPLISLLDTLLSIDPDRRGTAAAALESEFFKTEPFACDPSRLPTYPPSKEIDAKTRDEEARRRRPIGERSQRHGTESRRSDVPQAIPPIKANASFAPTMQQTQYPDLKSRSDISNSFKEDGSSRVPDDLARQKRMIKDMNVNKDSAVKVFHSGPLVNNRTMGQSIHVKEHIPSRMGPSRVNSTALTGVATNRTSTQADRQEQHILSQAGMNRPGSNWEPYHRSESMEKHMRMQNEPAWFGTRGNKIYISGPLLVQPNKVDQMLEEHDRQLQEFARQARKTRQGKTR